MTRTRLELWSGIVASALYVAMIMLISYEGYDPISQVPSELTAIGAPTRDLWFWLGLTYTVLAIVFAWGVRRSAGENRDLRIVGRCLLVFGLLGFVWPFAPMHQRQVIAAGGGDFGDTLHRALGIVTVVLFVSTLGFGAGAFGKRFRLYSLATLAICLVTGALVGVNSSRLAANLPTPLVGLWERICITAYMIWSAALAAALLRKPMTATPRVTQGIGRLRHDDDFSTTADATHSH